MCDDVPNYCVQAILLTSFVYLLSEMVTKSHRYSSITLKFRYVYEGHIEQALEDLTT